MLWDAPPRVFDPFAYPFAGEIAHAAIGAARDSAGRPGRGRVASKRLAPRMILVSI